MAQQRLNDALYDAQCIFDLIDAPPLVGMGTP
jgi:hypothetical protein